MKTAILILLSFLSTNIFSQETAVKPDFKDYEGFYELNSQKNAVLVVEGNKLIGTISTGGKFELEYIKKDEFEIKSEGTRIVFVRDAGNKVIKLISYEKNKTFEAIKIEPAQKDNLIKTTNSLLEYTGEYNADDKSEPLIVSEEGGKLFAVAGGDTKFELKLIKGDDFEIVEVSAAISFLRNSKKEIDGIKVITPDGGVIVGKKAAAKK